MSDTQSTIQISMPMIMCYQNGEKERNEKYKEQTQRNARNDKVVKKMWAKEFRNMNLLRGTWASSGIHTRVTASDDSLHLTKQWLTLFIGQLCQHQLWIPSKCKKSYMVSRETWYWRKSRKWLTKKTRLFSPPQATNNSFQLDTGSFVLSIYMYTYYTLLASYISILN